MSTGERRQRLLEVLCQRRRDMIGNLATEFGVSGRTIRRDIEELTLRYPIETIRGRHGGGVEVAAWFRLDCHRLTTQQTELLTRLAKDLQGKDLETMERILAQFAS